MPVAWAAGIAAVGSIATAAISSSAASSAADAQIAAQQRGMDQAASEREKYYAKGEGYLKPFSTLGTEQLPTLKSLLGQGEDGAAGMMAMLEKYPGYQFALDQGQRAISNQQIAGGSKYSGNAIKAASDYNRNMGAGLFQQYFNNVNTVANQGQAAAGGIANLAAGVGSGNASSLQSGNIGQGEAKSAGSIGSSNSWTGAIDSITGAAGKTDWGSVFGSPAPTLAEQGYAV